MNHSSKSSITIGTSVHCTNDTTSNSSDWNSKQQLTPWGPQINASKCPGSLGLSAIHQVPQIERLMARSQTNWPMNLNAQGNANNLCIFLKPKGLDSNPIIRNVAPVQPKALVVISLEESALFEQSCFEFKFVLRPTYNRNPQIFKFQYQSAVGQRFEVQSNQERHQQKSTGPWTHWCRQDSWPKSQALRSLPAAVFPQQPKSPCNTARQMDTHCKKLWCDWVLECRWQNLWFHFVVTNVLVYVRWSSEAVMLHPLKLCLIVLGYNRSMGVQDMDHDCILF